MCDIFREDLSMSIRSIQLSRPVERGGEAGKIPGPPALMGASSSVPY